MFVEDILREIDAALERRGISARAASIRAQGAPELIRDMRRGHVPSVERLRSLCEVLGLEFYVGPPRWRRAEDGGALPDVPLSALERAAQDLARLTVEAGGNPFPEELLLELIGKQTAQDPALPTPDAESEATALDVAIEMMSQGAIVAGTTRLASYTGEASEFAVIQPFPMVDAEEKGFLNPDQLKLLEKDPGYRDWLEGRNLDPAQCSVVLMSDDSMEPTLPNGSLAVVDSTDTDWDPLSITVVKFGDDMLLRRIVTDDEGRRLMVCDHPDWPDEPWPPDAQIVGQAKWVGRWLE